LWHSGLVAPQHVDLPRSGTEPVPPALADIFFTTELPGKPSYSLFLTQQAVIILKLNHLPTIKKRIDYRKTGIKKPKKLIKKRIDYRKTGIKKPKKLLQ